MLFNNTKNATSSTSQTIVLCLASAVGGAIVAWTWQSYYHRRSEKQQPKQNNTTQQGDPETDAQVGTSLVWSSIGGAMNAAMMYTGDRLKIYDTLRQLCEKPGSYTTAIELAQETGYNQRWLREWLAQQAAMGVLQLLPDGNGDDDASLHYRLPHATGQVLANPDSKVYNISMIQAVPALVNRAKTMLPEAFRTGIGRPYDEPDVSEAIDRQHQAHVRDFFIPQILPQVNDGKLVEQLRQGCRVADLGCGAGILLVWLAREFPNSTFHGFEISHVALEKAAFSVASAKLPNIQFHNANEPGEQLGDYPQMFDLTLVYDVLHDSTHPHELVQQVKTSLKPNGEGIFLLADIPSAPSVRDNIATLPAASTYYGISSCLCMSCALSTKDGAGLGTLGLSVPVAKKLVTENGFDSCEVLGADKNARWFLAK